MRIIIKKISNAFKQWNFPVHWMLGVFAVLDIFLFRYYNTTDFERTYSYTYAPFIELITVVILLLINLVFLVNIISFFFSVIYVHNILKRDTNLYFKFNTQDNKNTLELNLPIWVKPIFGHIKVGIEFENDTLNTQLFDVYNLPTRILIPLNHINNYKLKSLQLYQIDMLYFFKVKRQWLFDQSITQYPVEIEDFNYIMSTRKYMRSEEQHSDIKNKSLGEWLNFKDYENGDDVKRILWKVYAKNKSLVVRHQENFTFDNAESHIYIAFHVKHFDKVWGNVYTQQYALDMYKNVVWNLAAALRSADSRQIFHLPSFQDIATIDDFKEKLVAQTWVHNDHWAILQKSVTLVIPDTMDYNALETILEEASGQISHVVVIESIQASSSSILLVWMKKLLFKNHLFNDDQRLHFHSSGIIANKERILGYLNRQDLDVEIIKLA